MSKICADKSETEYSASSAYMWAYLAYLCEGKVGHKPEPADNVSSTEIKEAEAEAQRMYDEI
ncbi:MAG: hypothetical protein IJJ91_05250 [Synergistaceae bacterium]|nr:hypothetical protein [Synergistaceae bacterium]MBR0249047.1 hypothetical protein [Synergistaceae bacterium]